MWGVKNAASIALGLDTRKRMAAGGRSDVGEPLIPFDNLRAGCESLRTSGMRRRGVAEREPERRGMGERRSPLCGREVAERRFGGFAGGDDLVVPVLRGDEHRLEL